MPDTDEIDEIMARAAQAGDLDFFVREYPNCPPERIDELVTRNVDNYPAVALAIRRALSEAGYDIVKRGS